MRAFLRLATFILPVFWHCQLWQQTYPNRTVKMIVLFGAGGPADVYVGSSPNIWVKRPQSFIVEDRPGAWIRHRYRCGRKVGTDGYTLW